MVKFKVPDNEKVMEVIKNLLDQVAMVKFKVPDNEKVMEVIKN